MSLTPIDRSPDLLRLRTAGYNVQVTRTGFLLVHDVPYVKSDCAIATGTLVSSLELAGDVTVQPKDHTAKFIGAYPCDCHGNALTGLKHGEGPHQLADGLVANHSFSRKPIAGHFVDYFEKMTTYVALLVKHVAAIDPHLTALSGKVIEPEDDDSPFNYLDTASSRAQISAITAKLADEALALVGLGGTGSYVLDLVAKTPARKIHLFDADRFLTHNAFRAPGAPTIEHLRVQPRKVDHFQSIYSNMHRGITAHPIHLDGSNVTELDGMSFVFLCMEGGTDKRAIVDYLELRGTAFVDVGTGLYVKRDRIGGMLRTVLSLPDQRDAARARIPMAADDVENEYDKNIQVADLNALNACLAVMAWKKHRSFYFNKGRERFTSFTIGNSLLAKSDIV